MPLNWIDVSPVPFNALLLLEAVQLSWLPGWLPEAELGLALRANPAVEWYLRHKCPAIAQWVEQVTAAAPAALPDAAAVRRAELAVLSQIEDLLVYALDPAVYDAQPFLNWDSGELTGLVDFSGKTVVDIGTGTGRLALVAAATAATVFAVEPVANLRADLKETARRLGLTNVYPVDGLITDLPFPAGFADMVMGGHVFGGNPQAELAEVERITRAGGWILFVPGSGASEDAAHQVLAARGYAWAWFEEPRDGRKRKYWKQKEK